MKRTAIAGAIVWLFPGLTAHVIAYDKVDRQRQALGVSDDDWKLMQERAKTSWEPNLEVLRHEIQDYAKGEWPGQIYGTPGWRP